MSYIDVKMRETKLRELPTTESVLAAFEQTCSATRKVFLIHKEVMPIFIVICLDGPSHCPAELIIPGPWSNSEEKYQYFSFIKQMAADTRAVAVLMSGECWYSEVTAPPDFDEKDPDLRQFRPASEDPNRKEIVHITCASTLTTPRNRVRHAPIRRPRGKRPFLGRWEEHADEAHFSGDLFSLLPALGD